MNDSPVSILGLAISAQADLMHIVAKWAELTERLHGGGGKALTGMPRGASEALPIDVHVSDLMREIEDQARFYGQVIDDEVEPEHGCDGRCVADWFAAAAQTPGLAVPDGWGCPRRRNPITTSAMPALLEQVAQHIAHFAADEREALDLADMAHDLRERVTMTLDPRVAPGYLGPCPAKDCLGMLVVKGSSTSAICPECGERTTIDQQWAYLVKQLDERLMTIPEIVVALKMLDRPASESTVRRWVTRGDLVEAVKVEGGMGLYPLAQAKALAEKRVAKVEVAA